MNEEQEKYFLDKFIEYDGNVCKLKKIINNFISQAIETERERIINIILSFGFYKDMEKLLIGEINESLKNYKE